MSSTQDIQSPISDYYAGRSIFITGATGFMGKVLLEKLLRTCTGINRIYVLIRTKKGQAPQDRLKTMLEGRLFNGLNNSAPHVLEKVVAVAGDITVEKLGISASDEQIIINDVSVIFHAAATVKFDDDLADSIKMNVKGTISIIELARKLDSLSSLVHVSTAYSHCYTSSSIEEKFYPMPSNKWSSYSPDELIGLCEEAKAKGQDNTKDVIGVFPNTYTFTKAMAENVIKEKASGLPVAIMRPSIVVASWKEPIPGWVDNLNGPTGMIAAAGCGILHTVYVERSKKADLMPVDFAISLMCALPWKISYQTTSDVNVSSNIQIYNCTSGSKTPLKWSKLEESYQFLLKYPLPNMLWYPYGTPMTNNIYRHKIRGFLFHWIPAYCIDAFCYIARMKPKNLVKIVTKMTTAMKALEYFSTREWSWNVGNVDSLFSEMSKYDQRRYDFSLRYCKNWDSYFENYMIGMRQYTFKEEPYTLEACTDKLRKLYIVDQGMKFLFMFCILLFLSWLGNRFCGEFSFWDI